MIVCLRLFAGFTSFISKRAWSQSFSMGPEGTLESSGIELFQISDHDSDRHRYVSGGDQNRKHGCRAFQPWRVARVLDTERLCPAPQTVVQVHAQQNDGYNIDDRYGVVLKPL